MLIILMITTAMAMMMMLREVVKKNNGYFTVRLTVRVDPLGVSKKHQNWKFQDAPKNCGYTSPGNPKTP